MRISDQEYLDYEPSDDGSEEETAKYSQDEDESGSGGNDSEENEEMTGDDPRADRFGEPVVTPALFSVFKGYKRADGKEATLFISPAMIDLFKKNLLGEGRWNSEARDDMEDKYRLSREQARLLAPPSLKGTKLSVAADESADFGYAKQMFGLHQHSRDVVAISLRMHMFAIKAGIDFSGWGPVAMRDSCCLPLFPVVDYIVPTITD